MEKNRHLLRDIGIFLVKSELKTKDPWFLKLLMRIDEIEKDEDCPYCVMDLPKVNEMIGLLQSAREFILTYNKEHNENKPGTVQLPNGTEEKK